MRYRVYYNRSVDWPQCWSVDEGDQSSEINVCGVKMIGVPLVTRELPPEQRAVVDNKVTPSAWFEVDGLLRLEHGYAVFRP